MPEELQNLLDRIQKDGVEKAQAESDQVLTQAREEAAGIVKDAEAKAATMKVASEKDAEALVERGKKTLEQAARDVVLSVRGTIDATLTRLVGASVSEALSNDTLKTMLATVVETYCKAGADDTPVVLLLSSEQKQALTDFFMASYAAELKKGLEIKDDDSIVAGFRVSMPKAKLEHDFTEPAITEALCQLLRPQLAEIVKQAVSKDTNA